MPALAALQRFARHTARRAAGLVRMGIDFDAAKSSNRRRTPFGQLLSQDEHADPTARRLLIGSARDATRNFEIAAWAVRKHLDYVATFSRQVRTTDTGLNRELEAFLTEADQPENFDASHRFSRAEYLRLAEARRTEDGDVFTHLNRDATVDMIESDRIRTPAGRDGSIYTHGIRTGRRGQAVAYALHDRLRHGRLEYRRDIPARWIVPLAYYQRYDQFRGVSPLASALNRLRDTYEGFDYAHAKAKISQLIGLALYRNDDEALGDVTTANDTDGNPDHSATEIDFGSGPFQLDLNAEDKAEILESNTPANEFTAYSRFMIAVALKALDIPYSFFDESFTNYSGSRGALLLYEQSAANKREPVRRHLHHLDAWRLRLAILDGRLRLPSKIDLAQLTRQIEYIPAGQPWLDPLKEISADVLAVKNGLASRRRILKRRGEDLDEIAADLREEQALLAGLLPTPTPTPTKTVA